MIQVPCLLRIIPEQRWLQHPDALVLLLKRRIAAVDPSTVGDTSALFSCVYCWLPTILMIALRDKMHFVNTTCIFALGPVVYGVLDTLQFYD